MGQKTGLSLLSKVALDTPPFIYLIEGEEEQGRRARVLFDQIADMAKVTSIVTPLEILSHCRAKDRFDLCRIYERYFRDSGEIEVQPADWPICDQAIAIRAAYGLKVPDALQAATAMAAGAECLITNDRHMLRIKELKVVLFDELEL